MDPAKQSRELSALVARAKRSGLKVHHYPEENLAIIRLVPLQVEVPPLTPPPEAPPAPTAG